MHATELGSSSPAPLSIARVTAAASFGFALVQLDVTIVNVALPRMADALGAGVASLQWVVDAYALAFAVFLLSGGVLADRFGARRVYLSGLVGFALASLSCALTSTASGLIVGRAAQGIAAAAMIPSSLALLNHATSHDPALRARAVGAWTAVGSIAIASGPLLSGLLLSAASWQLIFSINLPICLLGALATLWATAGAHSADHPQTPRPMDYPGQLLALCALTCAISAVIELRPLGIAHPIVIGCAVGALASGSALIRQQHRSPEPLLPRALFGSSTYGVALVYGTVVNLTYYGMVFVLSLYLQRVCGYSALQTGIAYLPLTAGFFAINIVSGWLVGRIGSRWPMLCGAAIDAAGFALLLRLGPDSSYLAMLPAFALMPLGMGLGVPAMTTSVLANVDKRFAGRAVAALNAARQAGGAIGVAVFGALAGEAPGQIVRAMHAAALLSISLLLMAACLVRASARASGCQLSNERNA